jgi:hypothetical protein
LCALFVPLGLAAQLQVSLNPETDRAFEDFRKAAEARMSWTPRFASVRAGEVTIGPSGKEGAVEVQEGLIHDWSAGTLASGATVDSVLAVLRDYASYKNVYAPDVTESKLLSRDGDHLRAYLRIVKKKGISATLNSEYDVEYKAIGGGRWAKISRSTRIAELDGEKELPPGTGHGFLWHLNAYWLLEPRPNGVYIECRTLSLTRNIPAGLGWMIKPLLSSLPRESLKTTIEATVRAVR